MIYSTLNLCSLPITRRIFVISASLCPDPIKAGIPPVVFGAPMGGKAPPGDAIGADTVGAGAMGVGAATGAEAKKLSTSFEVIIPSMPLPAFMENKSICTNTNFP